MNPEEAIKLLIEGNVRYVRGHPEVRDYGQERLRTATEQHPLAVIVSCSDSRVPPEIIFDQGLGDLFVVRTAGHVIDEAVLGSIQYAVEHCSCSLVVVLGHERCGAVTAAVNHAEEEGAIQYIVDAIEPAVDQTQDTHGDPVGNAVVANTHNVVAELKADSMLREVAIIGGRYDLDSGRVTLARSND